MPYTAPKDKSVKEVRYLNKDFTSFKDNLIEFTKQYFPNEYNDFNESSPGMMFIEMASYVGDVLSYYIDNQFKESLLAFAEEKKTIYNMSQALGYKPKLSTAASTEVDIFQTAIVLGQDSEQGQEILNEIKAELIQREAPAEAPRLVTQETLNSDLKEWDRLTKIYNAGKGPKATAKQAAASLEVIDKREALGYTLTGLYGLGTSTNDASTFSDYS